MIPSRRHPATTTGAILLALLGLARGAGGVALMLRGPAVVESGRVTAQAARGLGAGLVVVALLGLGTAVALLRRHPKAARWAGVVLALFLADGAVNGALLFGRPTDVGTLVNLGAAAVIAALLWTGTRAPA